MGVGKLSKIFYSFLVVAKICRLEPKMNWLAFVLLLATGLTAVSAGINDIVDVHDGNANDYADEIPKNLRVRILNNGLDPLILPVKSFEFSKKILLVEVRASAKVYDGYLKGLSSLHRTGLASMSTNETHVKVRATIGVNDLVGSYKASAKFMNFGPQFTISLGMESVGVAFEVVQPIQKGSRPTLLSFGVVDLGQISAVVDSDLHILDWVLNKVNDFVINLVKDFVVVALEIPLKKLVQNVLDLLNSQILRQQ